MTSKDTHSTSGMMRRAHFPCALEGIVIDAQDRFNGRRPWLRKPVPSRSSSSHPAFSVPLSTMSTRLVLAITRDQAHGMLRKIMTPSHSNENESSIRAIVIPFSEDPRYVRERSLRPTSIGEITIRSILFYFFFSIQVHC